MSKTQARASFRQVRSIPDQAATCQVVEITLSLHKKQLSAPYQYEAFGLAIRSELPLPELSPANFDRTDVEIVFSSNPLVIENPVDRGVLYQASKDQFLFRLETVGSYFVQNGATIAVERLNNSSDDELRLFLLGSAFGALIHQRGLLPFHGSTVVKNNRALIISGQSGSGKSSLAAKLLERGYLLLSDDVSVIDWTDEKPYVYPGIPHLKLWEDIVLHLNQDPSSLLKVRPQLLKYKKPANQLFYDKAVIPEKIIILGSNNHPGIKVREIKGVDKFNVLKNNTYRVQYIQGLEQVESHFRMIGRLAGDVSCLEVLRPVSPILLDELADTVEELF